ncbi:MAG: toprim domain-containing protein [Caldilineaceae bacterium]
MNILDLIQNETGCTYRKAGTGGKEYCGVCPWCGGEGGAHGKGGRFRLWPGEGRYWCRECQKQGDSIQFMRDYKGLSFRQASEYVGMNHINDSVDTIDTVDTIHSHDTNHHQPLIPPCAAWTQRGYPFLADCQAALWDGRGGKVLAWLHGRGLSDATIRSAGLGYNDHDHYTERSAWGLPAELNDRGQPKGLWLPRGVVIPWTIDGALWGLRIRRPIGDPKYYFVPGGTANALYNADALTTGKPAVVLEGEIDALTVCQAGFVGVATGSTYAARRTRWLVRLALASTVLIAYDADEAGEKAAQYWLDALSNAKRWRPYWSDANQLAQDGVNVTAWLQAGIGQLPAATEAAQPSATESATERTTIRRLHLGHFSDPKFGTWETIEA